MTKKSASAPVTASDSKPLTQTQIRYARARVEALAKEKTREIADERDRGGGCRYWHDGEAMKLLRDEVVAGRYKMPSGEVLAEKLGYDLHAVLKFAKYPKGLDDAKKSIEGKKSVFEERIAAVVAEAMCIVDDLVLGNSATALAALAAFAAKKF